MTSGCMTERALTREEDEALREALLHSLRHRRADWQLSCVSNDAFTNERAGYRVLIFERYDGDRRLTLYRWDEDRTNLVEVATVLATRPIHLLGLSVLPVIRRPNGWWAVIEELHALRHEELNPEVGAAVVALGVPPPAALPTRPTLVALAAE